MNKNQRDAKKKEINERYAAKREEMKKAQEEEVNRLKEQYAGLSDRAKKIVSIFSFYNAFNAGAISMTKLGELIDETLDGKETIVTADLSAEKTAKDENPSE